MGLFLVPNVRGGDSTKEGSPCFEVIGIAYVIGSIKVGRHGVGEVGT